MITWLAALAVISNVTTAVISILGGGIVAAIITSLTNHRIAKENRDAQDKLNTSNQEHERQIQALTAELATLKHERDTLFTALHEHRREVIKHLNAELWDHYVYLFDFKKKAFKNPLSGPIMIESKEIKDKDTVIANYYSKNRIYFTRATSELIQRVIGDMQTCGMFLVEYLEDVSAGATMKLDEERIHKLLREDIKKGLDGLQDEFRKLLGVETPTN